MTEIINGKRILINTRHDVNVVGFPLLHWIKYVVPLKKEYGDVIIETASAIATYSPQQSPGGNEITRCWGCVQSCDINSGDSTDQLCESSNSICIDKYGIDFMVHGSGICMLAAGALLNNFIEFNEDFENGINSREFYYNHQNACAAGYLDI